MTTDHIFSGLKVVDVASFIAGPAATTVLSDFGADVIKVEPPGIGDPYRYFYRTPPNPALAEHYTWQLTNRNKRSLVVDLKHPRAADVLAPLVKWADVFVTNFPPRVKRGLKLTYEEISALNPRLIYADITGYGELGPEADKPGFDITAYWARSGLMGFTRNAGSPPAVPVPGIDDHATAISLYAGIVTGLYRRERTDLLADARFADSKSRVANAAALVAELDRVFGAQPLAYWKTVLDAARLPYGVVQIPDEIVQDPQYLANEIIIPIDDGSVPPRYTVNSPVTIKAAPKVVPRVAPGLGEHTDQVLQELGFDADQIDGLRTSGAIPRTK